MITNIVIFDDAGIKMEKDKHNLYVINKTPVIKILKISVAYKCKEHILSYTLNPNMKYKMGIYVKVAKIWIEDVQYDKPDFIKI